MGFFSQFSNAFKSLGKKIGQGFKSVGQKIGDVAKVVGKTALKGLDYGIQGAKIATDFADKYTLGLDHFIPYYSAIKAGIDVSDHIRKMVKGEEKLNWTNAVDMGLDVVSGAMSLHGGKAELEGLQGGYKMFKGARATGSSLAEAGKIAGGRVLRGYGLHSNQLKQMGKEGVSGAVNIAKAVRKGDPVAIAKVGAGIGAGATALEIKSKVDEEGQENTKPQPIVKPASQSLPVAPPVIHPLIKPITRPKIYVNPSGAVVDSMGNIYG
tara:strand:+ start:1109 stop:1909 length:801 start_codon:yes stop_codon:yes gene_type:complete